jgi:hypothetical protein
MPICPAILIRIALSAGLLWRHTSTAPALETSNFWLARAWQSDDGSPDNVVNGVAAACNGKTAR